MSLGAVQTNSARVGTCPHGLPLGACPICNGMSGGGGMKKADFSDSMIKDLCNSNREIF